MKPHKLSDDIWLIITIMAFGLMLLPAVGCASKEVKPTKEYAQSGKCFVWDYIEAHDGGRPRCLKSWPADPFLRCSRERGHQKRHHVHRGGSCLAQWQ